MGAYEQIKPEFSLGHVTLPGYAPFAQKLEDAQGLIDGLHMVKTYLKPFGVGDLLYGYMLHAKAHVRNEQLLISTFPKDIRQMFVTDGGTMSFKFGDMLPTMNAPVFYDLKAALNPSDKLFSYNRSAKKALEYGYEQGWIIPILSEDLYGYGFLMMFQDPDPKAKKLDLETLQHFGLIYHETMRKHKQMAGYFDLSGKQKMVLSGVAKGQTAADLAAKLGLAERTVELRLHEARKKLKARTTSEAVYKASAYLILPYHDD